MCHTCLKIVRFHSDIVPVESEVAEVICVVGGTVGVPGAVKAYINIYNIKIITKSHSLQNKFIAFVLTDAYFLPSNIFIHVRRYEAVFHNFSSPSMEKIYAFSKRYVFINVLNKTLSIFL